MENFILNLFNAWTFVDLAIMLILGFYCNYFADKLKQTRIELTYSEFMLKCEKTKLENEQTRSLSMKIENEKNRIENEKNKLEIKRLKFVVNVSEDVIKSLHESISRKNQPRDSQGHFAKIKKEPEKVVTEWVCNATKYEPFFANGSSYKPSEMKSIGNDLIWMVGNSGKIYLVHKSDFKPVTK